MNDSILETIKDMIGVSREEDGFDKELIALINGTISFLYRLGVGEDPSFYITSSEEQFSDFIPDSQSRLLSLAKLYMRDKVTLGFDISTKSTSYINSIEKNLLETEWSIVNSDYLFSRNI